MTLDETIKRRGALCRCHTCERDFHSLGIARHRAMHRDRQEDCTITFSAGDTYKFTYSDRKRNERIDDLPSYSGEDAGTKAGWTS